MMNYEGFGIRHIGASHIQKEIVCQDSVQYHQDLQSVSAAVSDGHGGQPYFRSDRGSAFAVQIACDLMREFLHHHQTAEEQDLKLLIQQIVQEWREHVKKDLLAERFTDSEMEKVTERNLQVYQLFSEKQRTEELPEEFPHNLFQAYGATLICMGFCENYGFALHIGDGKCVAIYPDGSTDEPIPWDEKCHLNICTSICDTDSEQEFRFYIWEKSNMPVAVFSASDGIDDSFAERLHSFYLHLAIEFISCGLRDGAKEIEKQLFGISERGSKDDVSICGIVNMSALQDAETAIQKRAESLQREAQLSVITQKLTELQFRYDKIQRILNACSEEEEDKIKKNQAKLEEIQPELEKLRQQKEELEKAEPQPEETPESESVPEKEEPQPEETPEPEPAPEKEEPQPEETPEPEPAPEKEEPQPEETPESEPAPEVEEPQPEKTPESESEPEEEEPSEAGLISDEDEDWES